VRENLETLLANTRNQGMPVARFVEREVRAYLTCGVLVNGFLRFRRDACGHDRLLTFSCYLDRHRAPRPGRAELEQVGPAGRETESGRCRRAVESVLVGGLGPSSSPTIERGFAQMRNMKS